MTNGEKFKAVFGFGADGSRIIAVNSTWWDCDFQIKKPKTKADRIRSMTDEELAEWLGDMIYPECVCCPADNDGWCKDCKTKWTEWLKKEAE